MSVNTVKIEMIANKLGVYPWRLREALDLPLEECLATTVSEARNAYRRAPSLSEQERSAVLKWGQLSLQEVKSAKTLETIEAARVAAPLNGEAYKLALRKIYELTPDPVEPDPGEKPVE